jgi:hypothetical protein
MKWLLQKKPKTKKIVWTFINNLFLLYIKIYKRDRMINKTEINQNALVWLESKLHNCMF